MAAVGILVLLIPAYGQERLTAPDSLEQLSGSIHNVVAKVSPAIVRLEVVGYNRSSEGLKADTHLITKSESIASGVIMESNGYIVTNAHALEGAREIRVVLDPRAARAARIAGQQDEYGAATFQAHLIGTFQEADLALVKIDATGLPVLLWADSDSVRPGELVLAIGNPEGLNNSVSMGVVSAVARQSEEDRPPLYIQTDAAINAGSSGGALVDIRGNLIGITSFILTEGGGSEGLGFALPSKLVNLICRELKASGHFHPGETGLRVQGITSTIASALKLSRNSGVLVSDILPDSPANTAGIKVEDVIVAVDGSTIDSVAQFATAFYNKRAGDQAELEIIRGSRSYTIVVNVRERKSDADDNLLAGSDQKSTLRPLCATVTTLEGKSHSGLAEMRSSSGVLVVDKFAQCDIPIGVEPGDVIRSLNNSPINNVDDLRARLQGLKSGDAVALQVERHNKFRFVAFEFE